MSSDTKELRGDAPTDLVCALDALALGLNISRTAYINKVLQGHVVEELHRVSVVSSMLRGNPLMPVTNRRAAE